MTMLCLELDAVSREGVCGGGCVEGVWRVCVGGGCVEGVWRVCGGCVGGGCVEGRAAMELTREITGFRRPIFL